MIYGRFRNTRTNLVAGRGGVVHVHPLLAEYRFRRSHDRFSFKAGGGERWKLN